MLRDFDSDLAQDRTFKIGGQTFTFWYPHWTVGAEVFDEDLAPTEKGDGTFSWKQDTEKAIGRIISFLDPADDSPARFKKLVARKENAVPRHQLVELYKFLWRTTSGLPTTPPSELDSGGGSTDSSSLADVSSPEDPTTA